jgi:ABC-2 type transport system ATP-binding protein
MAEAGIRNNSQREVAIRAEKLTKRYGELVAVNALDLLVYRGEIFGLLGPNGAGKTTTVEILEGLNDADGGAVELLGQKWGGSRNDRRLRERIGVQLQETRLAEKLTVIETVRLFRSFFKKSPGEAEVIRRVGLEDKTNARVGKLSGGQNQRLSVACALVGDPELLFLDEPTTGLDPQARLNLWELIKRFNAAGGTVLITTHNMEEAERLCSRVAIMDRGRMIALGSPAELIASLGADQIIEFGSDKEIDFETIARLPWVKSAKRKNSGFLLTVNDTGAALGPLIEALKKQDAKLVNLTTHSATLEDVFISLTGRLLRDE